MPSFVKLDKTSYSFIVDIAKYEQPGAYKIGWKLGYAEFPEGQVKCTISLEVKYLSQLIGETIDVQTLVCKLPWSFKIPTFKDIFQETLSSKVNLGVTSEFLFYNKSS